MRVKTPIKDFELKHIAPLTPTANSEIGITSRLNDVSERKSYDDAASLFSSGFGIMTPPSPTSVCGALDPYKLKEIKHYVSHELYKCQKKTD